MTERRYNDEEIAAIFRKAVEGAQALPEPANRADGLTLGELQTIGREVGIAPEAVSRAARSLTVSGGASSQRFVGMPIGVARSVELDHRLSDDEWEQLVVELRQVFNARGQLRSEGSFRQWTNGNLQALLEPTPTGQRLTLRTMRGNSRVFMMGGLGLLGLATAVTIAGAFSGSLAHSASSVLELFIIGGGLFGLGALPLPGWARLRGRQMDGIIARLSAPTAD